MALFKAIGLDVSAEDIAVMTNDVWSIGLSASLRLEGTQTGLRCMVGFAFKLLLSKCERYRFGDHQEY